MALGAWLDGDVSEGGSQGLASLWIGWLETLKMQRRLCSWVQSATFEILLGCRRDAQATICLVSRVTREMKKKSPR